jgi:hypothetical protein
LVTIAQPFDGAAADTLGVRGIFFVVFPDSEQLRGLTDLAAAGKLRPVIARAFPLPEAALAYSPAPTPRRPGKDSPRGSVMTTPRDACTRRATLGR